MLVMGRTQGKGCYCFVNGVLKAQLDKYIGNYSYMIMDNEAGLEHISAAARCPHVDTHAPGFRLLPQGHPGRGAHCRDGRASCN